MNQAQFILRWWYGTLPGMLRKRFQLSLAALADFFSFGDLARTLFYPWKRDIYTAQNQPLGKILEAWEMNLMSRLIGFVIRSSVIIGGGIIFLFSIALAVLLWVIIILAPALLLILLFLGSFNLVR